MLKIISDLRQRAKGSVRRIVLPEGEDERIVEAAAYILQEGLADLTILGNKEKIEKICKQKTLALDGADIIEPETSELLDSFTASFYELRKAKGMTQEEARRLLVELPTYFAAMLVREKKADGFVAGAMHTTRDVARSALYCIGLNPKIGTMSSSFIMIHPDESFGERGIFIFADCAIVPDPSPRKLANIALCASKLMKDLLEATPRVAMLSFSTKGSGNSESAEKIAKALALIKEKDPGLLIDGELQADAALIPDIASIKAPDSPIDGKANILIFPNLEAGNIAYKITQRLAKARAVGPLLHGILAPCSDLSRGCSVDDVIDIVCVTAIRCAHVED